jgi:hypothetical protein
MLVNEFIDKMLKCLSRISDRLQDPLSRLQIQAEMQNQEAFDLITYFIRLQPEYVYNWKLINARKTVASLIDLTSLSQFQFLELYMASNQLLDEDEIVWLDDAIHDVLISD